VSRSSRSRSIFEPVLPFCLAVLVSSCGGSTPTDPDPDPDPATISISIDPSTGTVEQGGSLVVTGTATIGGAFSGGVTFAVTGLPAGVTISVGTITTSGSTATAPITVTVGASVAAGTYSGTITASGSGVSDSVAYSLTVTEAPGFSLGTVENISIQQGTSGSRAVAIERTGGFAESVTITVEGAPAGMTVTPDPGSTAGTSSTLGISVGGAVAVNTYTLTVRGAATGLPDATTTFDVTVTASVPPDGTNFRLDFSLCTTDERPTWLAVKDGMAGSWTAVTGVADVYEFTITQSTLGVAVVYDAPAETDLSVDYFATTEAVVVAAALCADGSGKAVTGTVTGTVGPTNLSLGGSSTTAFLDGIFGITNVRDGLQDFVGYSTNLGAGSDRMFILRDQDIADGGDIGTIDFTADGFDPATATITVGGLVGGEDGAIGTNYATSSAGSFCAVAPLKGDLLSGSSFTASSAPASQQAAGEYHVANISTVLGNAVKTVQEAFEALTARTVDLPADMPAPTLTDVTGSANYLRLQADFTLPAELDSNVLFDYAVGSYNMTVFATAAVMSGSVSLTMPDFSGLAGWDDAWGIPLGTTGIEYVVSGRGGTGLESETAGLCTDGGRVASSTLTGSYN